jgi:hypothetical protein
LGISSVAIDPWLILHLIRGSSFKALDPWLILFSSVAIDPWLLGHFICGDSSVADFAFDPWLEFQGAPR